MFFADPQFEPDSIHRCAHFVCLVVGVIVAYRHIIVICPFAVSVLVRHRFVLNVMRSEVRYWRWFSSSIVFSGEYFFVIVLYEIFSQSIAIPLSSDTAQYGT